MKLKLAYYGNPILRKRAEEVPAVTEEIKQIVQEMDKVMHESKGVGLAAPQIGLSIRLFILRVEIDGKDDEESTLGPLEVYINPKILPLSESLSYFNEGCLSIPGIKADVLRPDTIIVEALDFDGKPFKMECDGLRARIIMHENDHINGVLFIDRLPKQQRDSLEPRLRAIKKKYTK